MSSLKSLISPLPYFANSEVLFSGIAQLPWSIFLDSGWPQSNQGRYDIIATDPICTLVTHGNVTVITQDSHTQLSYEDPFDLVKRYLTAIDTTPCTDLPFNGGAIGYFSYDLARRLEHLPIIAEDAEHIAEMAIGIYAWAVIVDHHERKSYLVGQSHCQQWEKLIVQFSQPATPQQTEPFAVLSRVKSSMDKADYGAAYNRIKHYLKEGDCYQVNLTQRFVADCKGDPWRAYQHLRAINSAPFSGYLNLPEVQILSSSPECFLKVMQGIVETKPIKGTRPRRLGTDDVVQIEHLTNSSKDQAENVMIVDLLRNDISKTCKKGSVKVPTLFAVESYATVHHLVSTITGILREDQHALDLLKSCFPGGSITGAPKIRAMEIIEELEPNRRGIYCGSIGYIGFNGNMDSNIAIRTLVHSSDTIRFWAGGGIVNDSILEEEYQECFDKAAAMLHLLQQLTVADKANTVNKNIF